jgi:hypothetical protein
MTDRERVTLERSLRECFVDTVPLMWDQPEFEDVEDDWEPLRLRRARPIRFLAILIVIAMVLALVIPVLLRALQDDEPDGTRPDGVQAAVVAEHPSITSAT